MWKKTCFLIFILFVLFHHLLGAQTRRALLVGINIYQPEQPVAGETQTETGPDGEKTRGNWFNLDGAVNDMEAMKAILIARYGFKPDDIRVLKNARATRRGILSGFQDHLIAKSGPGDIALFFYAGHGSQVKNSRSREADKFDESLVPSDSYRGVPDIRDKELWKLYNQVQDRGARLTVIIDACHSGSISRGLTGPTTYRYLSPDGRDASDPTWYNQTPAEKGALVFSATQDFQQAAEMKDQDNTSHGLFTWALLKILREGDVDAPAARILMKVKALIRSQGKTQEPNIEATPVRKNRTLFGIETSGLSGRVTVAALKILGSENRVELQGGLATGIREGCELKQVLPANIRRSPARLVVTEVRDLNRSLGRIIRGEPKHIQPGDLFHVDRWVVTGGLRLGVMASRTGFSRSGLVRLARDLFQLVRRNGARWVTDPVEQTPTHILSWQTGGWKFMCPDGRIMEMGTRLDREAIEKAIHSQGKKCFFFFNVPLGKADYDRLLSQFQNRRSLVRMADSHDRSHYVLTGRFVRDRVEYALVLPNVTRDTSRFLPLPARTDWIATEMGQEKGDHLSGELNKYALRIMKIKAWLELSPPPQQVGFPYHLKLQNALTGETKTGGEIYEDEVYGLVLETEDTRIGPRFDFFYVYVFSIDSFGRGTLLFPNRVLGTIENKLPAQFTADNRLPRRIPLGNEKLFRVDGDSFGVITFFLLVSRNPIPDPGVLQMDGVRTRGMGEGHRSGEARSPLQDLINFMAAPKRGIAVISPGNWSIERLSVLGEPAERKGSR